MNDQEYTAKLSKRFKKRRITAIQPNYYGKVPDPFNPKFYTIYRFFVPMPNQATDEVCILACVRNAQNAVFQRFANTDDLVKVFNLSLEHISHLENALKTAATAKAIILDLEEQKIAKLSSLPA